jgi:hypothetical protein
MPLLAMLMSFLTYSLNAQSVDWVSRTAEEVRDTDAQVLINAIEADYYEINFEQFYEMVFNASDGDIIELPIPSNHRKFHLKRNGLIPDALAERYPSILSFDIISEQSRNTWGKLSISPYGMSAIVLEPGKSAIHIDPARHLENSHYIVYRATDLIDENHSFCGVSGNEIREDQFSSTSRTEGSSYNECELNTYIIAVGTTGEYTGFHGGTVEQGLAAVVGIVNLINAIWERDFAVTTILSENNDLVIFTDPTTDGYDNFNNGAVLDQNQENLDNLLLGEYDIGHAFTTGGGGLAQLATSCTPGVNARCMSGNQSFLTGGAYARLCCHEMGHQFEGNHTFNASCGGNRNGETAVEPGAGTTIMSYAGTGCPPQVQFFADSYYHGITMGEIGPQIDQTFCQQTAELDNLAPTLEALPDLIVIPGETPFALTAIAEDLDGDVLTYCWEQTDNEIIEHPPTVQTQTGTVFRSRPPSTNPTRYFPPLPDAVSTTWEVLPGGFRDIMNFRVSVRDNAPGGGCTQYAETQVEINDNAGPLVVEFPSDDFIVWQATTQEMVQWDVAGTDDPIYQGELVDIFLSTDGGFEYPIVLAENVPNNGTAQVTVPLVTTNQARVMVMNSAGTFFDVSDNVFSIQDDLVSATSEEVPEVAIYPNPTNGLVTISLDGNVSYRNLLIRDVSGRLIYSRFISPSERIFDLDLHRFEKGLYLVSFTYNNKEYTIKLVKTD